MVFILSASARCETGCLSLRAVTIEGDLIRSRGKFVCLRKNSCFIKKFRENCQKYVDSFYQNNISVKIDNQTCNFFARWIPTGARAVSTTTVASVMIYDRFAM